MRLNLGAGEQKIAGWKSVDVARADVSHDLSVFPWPFDSNSAESINASHVLEHFDKQVGADFLAECCRILKPGGWLRIAVPDLDLFIDCVNAESYERLNGYEHTDLNKLMGGGDREPNLFMRHHYAYTAESLETAMRRAGFRHVARASFTALDNPTYMAISLYMQGYK